MSIFDIFNPSRRTSDLEKRVELLEAQLLQTSHLLKSVTALTLEMAGKLEAIARYAQEQQKSSSKSKVPPDEDFYN